MILFLSSITIHSKRLLTINPNGDSRLPLSHLCPENLPIYLHPTVLPHSYQLWQIALTPSSEINSKTSSTPTTSLYLQLSNKTHQSWNIQIFPIQLLHPQGWHTPRLPPVSSSNSFTSLISHNPVPNTSSSPSLQMTLQSGASIVDYLPQYPSYNNTLATSSPNITSVGKLPSILLNPKPSYLVIQLEADTQSSSCFY